MHVIGDGKNPVYICKKKEVPKLFNESFWKVYYIWFCHHNGFGLPDGLKYEKLDPDVFEMLNEMEMHYRNNFTHSSIIVKYLETIIKILTAKPQKKPRSYRRR